MRPQNTAWGFCCISFHYSAGQGRPGWISLVGEDCWCSRARDGSWGCRFLRVQVILGWVVVGCSSMSCQRGTWQQPGGWSTHRLHKDQDIVYPLRKVWPLIRQRKRPRGSCQFMFKSRKMNTWGQWASHVEPAWPPGWERSAASSHGIDLSSLIWQGPETWPPWEWPIILFSTFPHSSADIEMFVLQVKSQAPSNGPPNSPTMLHALPLSAHLDTITFSLPPSRDKRLPAPLPSCMTSLGMDQDTHTSILHSSPVIENVVRLSRIYGW